MQLAACHHIAEQEANAVCKYLGSGKPTAKMIPTRVSLAIGHRFAKRLFAEAESLGESGATYLFQMVWAAVFLKNAISPLGYRNTPPYPYLYILENNQYATAYEIRRPGRSPEFYSVKWNAGYSPEAARAYIEEAKQKISHLQKEWEINTSK